MTLSPADWSELLQLLDDALERPEPERARWLDTLGPGAARLRPALRQLLDERRAIETGDFLKALPALPAAAPAAGFAAGQRIGPWELLRELGQGGMASVWLARRADAAHQREVALKLPWLGARARVIGERFVREREILSALTHPHIASVLDAGSDGAQPWLALEFVSGEPITTHAATHGLGTAARLRLMLQVLQAVQHAHAQLVIHRDIKPANVLVDAQGQVKLLDFGVAKLLEGDGATRETELTQFGGRAMTPQYASPEQVAGQPLGTPSDVYSLGVLLYELLTGRLPYTLSRSTPAALEEAILGAHVLPPSGAVADPATARALRGDIDTLVAKAMATRPADRYASAEAMAGDIERHLASLPILARPASAGYRLRKLFARHRLMVGAGALAGVSLLVGLGAALWQADRARTSARQARQEAARAEQTRDFLLGLLRAGDPALLGGRAPAQTTLGEVIDRAESQIDRLPPSDTELRKDMLVTLSTIRSTLDQTDRAVALLEQALELSRRVDGVPHAYQAQVLSALASTLLFGNRQPQAAARNAELGALLQQLGDERSIAYARHVRLNAMLLAAKDSARMPEVRDLLLRAAVIFARDAPADPGRMGTLYGLARAHAGLGDMAAALAAADEAVQAAEVSERPQLERPNARSLRAAMRSRAGQLGAALDDLRAADEGYLGALGPRHFLTLQNQGLLGELLHATGARDEGLARMQASLAVIREVRAGTSTHGHALERLAAAQVADGHAEPALALLDEAERLWATRGPDFARAALETHVQALEQLGRFDDAAARLDALRALNAARDGGKPDAATLLREGQLARARGDAESARRALEQCLAVTGAPTRAERWRHAQALDGMARLDLQQGRAESALGRVERLAAVVQEPALREDLRARALSAAAAAACAGQEACRRR